MGEIKIFETADQMQLQFLQDKLKSHHIPSYLKETAAGEHMNLTMGYSVFPKAVYVSDKDAVEARVLTEECFRVRKKVKEKVTTKEVAWYRNRVVVARIILVCVGLVAAFSIGVNFLQ